LHCASLAGLYPCASPAVNHRIRVAGFSRVASRAYAQNSAQFEQIISLREQLAGGLFFFA
jgi:hypothetical protein